MPCRSLATKLQSNPILAYGLYTFGDLSAEWDVAGPDPDTMKIYVDCFGGLEVDGLLLALSAVPATGRTARAVTEPEALDAVRPTLGWRRSLFELLLANGTSERARDRHTGRLPPKKHTNTRNRLPMNVTGVTTGSRHAEAGSRRVVARRFGCSAGPSSSAFNSALARCNFLAAAFSAGSVEGVHRRWPRLRRPQADDCQVVSVRKDR